MHEGNQVPPLHPLLAKHEVKQHGSTAIIGIKVPQLLKFWSKVIVPLAHTKKQIKGITKDFASVASKIEAIKLVHINGVSREIVENLPAPKDQSSKSDQFLTESVIQILIGVYPPTTTSNQLAPGIHVSGVVAGHPDAKRLGVYNVSFANSRFISVDESHELAQQINAALPEHTRVKLQIDIRRVNSETPTVHTFRIPTNVSIAGQTIVWIKNHPVITEHLPEVLLIMFDKIQSLYSFYDEVNVEARYIPIPARKLSHQEEWDLVSRSAESAIDKYRETFSSELPATKALRLLYPDIDLNPTEKRQEIRGYLYLSSAARVL